MHEQHPLPPGPDRIVERGLPVGDSFVAIYVALVLLIASLFGLAYYLLATT
jgi:hypothetical protein